jgi:hypothetical protein
MNLKNPFVYGEEVSGENFCNRKNEIADLLSDIENGQNVILFSPRRYGKTSLIKEVLRKAEKKGILTFYIDLYPAITKEKFIEIYAASIALKLKGRLEKVIDTLKSLIPSLTPKAVIKPDGSFTFEFAFERRGKSFTPILEDLFNVVHERATREKVNAVIVFDEFQEITNYGDEEIERKMRSVFQSHRNVSYIFMGSKRHLLDEIFNKRDRAFYKSGKHFLLKKIDDSKLFPFIKNKFEQTGFKILDSVANQIIIESENHPYYVQFLCNIIWEQNLSNRNIHFESISEGITRLLNRESSAYYNIWESLTIKQKQTLIGLITLDGSRIFSRGFLLSNNLAASTVQKTIENLYQSGIIEKDNGNYVISDVFFKKWIQKLISITPTA